MILLTLNKVTKTFVVNTVLKDIDLVVSEGQKMGLVGVNGSGKSTLLKLVTGELEPDSGNISLMKGTTVGIVTQQADIEGDNTVLEELERVFEPVREMERKLRAMEHEMGSVQDDPNALSALSNDYSRLMSRFEDAGGYVWPSRIQGVLAGLSFAKDRQNQKARLLSGGEKTRLCLARTLLSEPDLLLLDEPTNHLDLNSTQWLEETLKKYKGTVIVISHDRYFLNSICDSISEISMTRLTQYTGNYDQYSQKRAQRLEQQIKEYKLQQAEILRQQAIIARFRSYNREKSIRAAESRERRLEKMELIEKPVNEQKVRFSFEARRRTGDDVLIAKDLSMGFNDKLLFENFNLHVKSGERVAIIGPNGVGKTTLLNIIVKKLMPFTGEVIYGANVDVGYYDQQQAGLHNEKDILSEVWDEFPRLEPNDVRSVLALFLLTGEDVFRPIGTLSGGERGRVALAKLMLKKDNLLILDEPTNHLDMDSREVLEGALDSFEGTIITVSHDRYFINRVANRVIEMDANGTTEYLGNYDDYLEKKRILSEGDYTEAIEGKTKTQIDKEKKKERAQKENLKAKKERLKTVEKLMAEKEQKKREIDALLAEGDTWKDRENALSLQNESDFIQIELDELFDEWVELSE